MTDAFRLWFIVAYGLGFLFFLVSIVRFRARGQAVERRLGPLPQPPALISWLIPPIILLTEVGQISATWLPVRVIGVGLSLYAMVMMPWATHALGHSYAPGPAVLQAHTLVTSGPFRLVRHPIYSAVAALWLGAALGALNWILLGLWPMLVVGVTKSGKTEEEMLRAKFGDAYDAYAATKGDLVPKLRVASGPGKPFLGLGICALALACNDPLGFGGLRPTFVASPDTVVAGDTIEVSLTLHNATRYPQTIRSSYGCLFFLETSRGEEPVPWEGTNYACAAAITDFTIPPGDSLLAAHQLAAAEIGTAGNGSEEVLPPGAYRIRTRMNADLPDLEAVVTVIDAVRAAK